MTVDRRIARWWRVPEVRQLLEDLVAIAELAREVVSRGRQAYVTDNLLPLAGEAIIARLGEAVNRLPDEFKTDFPEVPWTAVRAMRNLIAHQYETVRPERVWTVLESDLPKVIDDLGLGDLRR